MHLRKESGLPWWLSGKESIYNGGDAGSVPGLGRFPGEGHSNPLQYSCLENPHGQRSLEGYSPWGSQKVVEGLSAHTQTHRPRDGYIQEGIKQSLLTLQGVPGSWVQAGLAGLGGIPGAAVTI